MTALDQIGYGIGKTTLERWLILWFMFTRRSCKVPVAANSQDQLRDTIWPEIANWHRQLPEALKALFGVQTERVVVLPDPEAAFAVRRTASKENPEALQGFHADHLLFLIDEASGIPDVVFEVGMGALSTPGAKVVMAGNPTRTSGFFYDTHHRFGDRWHTMHVSCLDVPTRSGTHRRHQGQVWRGQQRLSRAGLGEFPTSDDETVIPLELVLGAVGRNVSTLDYHPVWGVDVARFGDDRTALAKRQKNKLLEPVKSWNSTNLMATVGRIKAEYDATPYDAKPSEILIDIIGLGAGVYDRCREFGLPVRGINVGEAAAHQRTACVSERALVQRPRVVSGSGMLNAEGRRPDCRADGTHVQLHLDRQDGRGEEGRHEEAWPALA